MKTQTLAARASLRQILRVNGVSETKKYGGKALAGMPSEAAYAWLLAAPITRFNGWIDTAGRLVNNARLGAPLGAGPLWGVPGVQQEATQAVITLLWLGKWESYITNEAKQARRNVLR